MTTTTGAIQVKRGTAAAWTSANPTLAAGEWAYETDTKRRKMGDGSTAWTSLRYADQVEWGVAVGDETTTITTGNAKVTFRMPFAMTVTSVRASLNTVSSSGIPTFDINEGGTTILSTKLTIDVGEKTSTTAAVPAVISDPVLADDAEITVDIDVAGTGAKGPKIVLLGYRT